MNSVPSAAPPCAAQNHAPPDVAGFCSRLRTARLAKGWTQQQVAEAVPMHRPAYTLLEAGKAQRPSLEQLTRLAVVLGVSTDALLGLEVGR